MQAKSNDCTAEQRKLASFIKSVHRQLREKVMACGDVEHVWAEHCCDESGMLDQYAAAMHHLATDIWPQNNAETRIEWCYMACMDYFFGGGLKRVRDKAARRHNYQCCTADAEDKIKNINDNINCGLQSFNRVENVDAVAAVQSTRSLSVGSSFTVSLPFSGKIRLLDVGSCYNPFQAFAEFSAVGIDICPAVNSVFKSDMLQLNLTAPLKSNADMDLYFEHLLRTDSEKCMLLDSFVAESCHVVVFSLLLEYLPTSKQRVACCQTAWKLLIVDGLLLIVTPDSRHQHRNHRFTRDWRNTIESIGFARCRYEKLQHLHCMAFRKLETDDCQPGEPVSVDSALCIPQDRDNCVDAGDIRFCIEQKDTAADASVCRPHSESYVELCSELPGTVSD